MAKKKGWFDRVKRFFGSEKKSKQEKNERKKRWISGRLKLKCAPSLPAPSLQGVRSLRDAEEEQSKHAVAVAVATAAAADAAVAAAQAAARVVRLTGTPQSYRRSREYAASRIQTAFRGYLARKALQALKGLVKLQALIRGQGVRRQTSITLRGLKSLIKIQSEACANRVRTPIHNQVYEDKNIVQWKSKISEDTRTMVWQNGERKWDSSTLSKEDINLMFRSRLEAALKRERALEYASSKQEHRNLRRPNTPISKEANVLNQRWSWLDQWIGSQPLDKDIPEIAPAPSPEQNVHVPRSKAPDTIILLDPVHKEKLGEPQLRYLPRRSFNQSRKTPPRDADSFTSSPAIPSYMASTASAKARFRSLSTPKQRRSETDTCSDQCTSFTSRLLSPFPSIVSETTASRTVTRPTVHQKSPCLKSQTAPAKSYRSSDYLSLDSECSLLNWDHHSVFR